MAGQVSDHLDAKVVMVSGASSGIGWDFCIDLAARRMDRLKSLCDEINQLALSSSSTSEAQTGSPRAAAVELDVGADGSTIDKSVQKAWEVFGHIDPLINNAGVRGNSAIWIDFLLSSGCLEFSNIKVQVKLYWFIGR